MINKNPKHLKDSIEGVQTALKGIECLVQFGTEKLQSSAKELIDKTLTQLNTFMPKILEGLAGTSSLRFNSPDHEEIFQKICEAKEMEEVFQKLDNFQGEYEKLKLINVKNQNTL